MEKPGFGVKNSVGLLVHLDRRMVKTRFLVPAWFSDVFRVKNSVGLLVHLDRGWVKIAKFQIPRLYLNGKA